MSIAYPLTAAKARSQSDDNLVAIASRYLEQHLGRTVGWYELVDHLKLAHGKTHEQASHGALLATLDLEWTGVLAVDVVTERYRRPQPGDPQRAELEEVAAAVLSLGWPAPTRTGSRKIQHAFLELKGRYRHCDVYWAMHERLKGRDLECHRAYWRKRGEGAIIAAKLADPSTAIAERVELEQQLEAELVADYVAILDHPVIEQHKLVHGLGCGGPTSTTESGGSSSRRRRTPTTSSRSARSRKRCFTGGLSTATGTSSTGSLCCCRARRPSSPARSHARTSCTPTSSGLRATATGTNLSSDDSARAEHDGPTARTASEELPADDAEAPTPTAHSTGLLDACRGMPDAGSTTAVRCSYVNARASRGSAAKTSRAM